MPPRYPTRPTAVSLPHRLMLPIPAAPPPAALPSHRSQTMSLLQSPRQAISRRLIMHFTRVSFRPGLLRALLLRDPLQVMRQIPRRAIRYCQLARVQTQCWWAMPTSSLLPLCWHTMHSCLVCSDRAERSGCIGAVCIYCRQFSGRVSD